MIETMICFYHKLQSFEGIFWDNNTKPLATRFNRFHIDQSRFSKMKDNGMNRRRPTMNDVAQLAGLSVATVDRVLNRRAPVRQSTAERILKSAEELKYYATPLLRSQVQALRRPVRCAVLLHSGTTPFCQALEENLRQGARTKPEIAADFKVVCSDEISSKHVADRIDALS